MLELTDPKKISENLIEAVPQVYPPEITAIYTDVPVGALGPDAEALLARVKANAETPYDLAKEIVRVLGNKDEYTYSTDVTDLTCSSSSQVECFARYKRGYCLHYASTMAMLLRAAYPENPIPTRLVEGFLPGNRVGNIETVENRGAHAWVEVYFPGYGWIPFDPTGPGVGSLPDPDGGSRDAAAAALVRHRRPGRRTSSHPGADRAATRRSPPTSRAIEPCSCC